MIECFTFDLKFETYFLTENIFSQKTMMLVLVTYQEKIRVLFPQGNGHNSFWNQFCMIYIQPLSLHSEGQSWSTRLSEKSRKRLEFFFMYCFSVRFEFFQETSIHRKPRGQARIIVMYVDKNSPIFLLFYWFRYRFYSFFCISINSMLQKTK